MLKDKKNLNLVVKKGNEILRVFTIKKIEILVGRSPENDLVLDDNLVSRRHFKIFIEDDDLFIEDMGSKNGTFLNGHRIKKEKLNIGDEISVGIYNIILTTEDFGVDESTRELLNIAKRLSLLTKDDREKILKLEEIALKDELSGLHNRRAFYQVIKNLLKKARESYIFLLDIDNFKKFNDVYGHETGDMLIVFISKILRELEDRGFVVRWGGEEFLIVLPDITKNEVIKIAEDLLFRISNKSEKEIGKKITVSIGITLCDNIDNFEYFINRADKALLKAKKKGKNRFEFI
ncbi:MAG: GGDEF domain-containing protein [Candidatus Hydrothermales bacterium]